MEGKPKSIVTFCSIILAGKVGSYITSSIGSMRVTEQIDALEIMGVNSLNYLVLPKIIATVLFYPFLIILGMFLSALLLLASINVNTANKNELMTIKGIGEKKAELLILFRKSNKINNLNDLSKIKGFGPKLISNIKNDVKKKNKKESKSMKMMKTKK